MKVRIEIDLGSVWNRLKDLAGKFGIEHFLLLYFAVHMLQIAFPSDGSMIFDEAHYVPASVATLNGIAANAEHPPLPKIISAIGIALLGSNWFGWRIPQVLMQVMALCLFYLIAKRFLGHPWALGATMLLGLDTIFFIHGGALLIDMAMFLFGFLAVELYFRKRYGWSAASMGLAFAAREMSIFLFAALAIYHVYAARKSLKPGLKIGLRYTLIALLVFSTVMFAYDLAYLPPRAVSVSTNVNANIVLDPSGSPVTTIYSTTRSTSKDVIWNPWDHIRFIASYHGPQGLVINESYAPYQYAWNWILPVDPVPESGVFHSPSPLSSPTYFRVDVKVSSGTTSHNYIPIWYRAQANLPVWYGIWPAAIGLVYALLKRIRTGTAVFALSGLVLNYAPWLVMSMLVRRIGFNYYMIYTLPFIALGLAFTWKLLPERFGKMALFLNILLALAFFVWFFPVRPMPPP